MAWCHEGMIFRLITTKTADLFGRAVFSFLSVSDLVENDCEEARR